MDVQYIETVEDFFRGAPELGWPDYLLYLGKQQKLLEPENESERPSRRVRNLLAKIRTQRRRKNVFLAIEAQRQNAVETLLCAQRDLAAFSSLATTQNAIAQTLLPVPKKLNVNKCRIAKKRHTDSEDAQEIMQKKPCLERQHKSLANINIITEHNVSSNKSMSEASNEFVTPSLDNDPFIGLNKDVEDNFIVDDVGDLYFDSKEQPHDYKIGNINVSQLFRQWQNESVKISKNGGLLVESNVHEILSLSSVFLLVPGSHSKTMVNIFGSQLLDEIHQQSVPPRNVTLNSECESKFREAIKKAKQSRDSAMDWFHQELINNLSLKKNLGLMVLRGLETLPNEKVRNEPSEATLITNYLDYVMKATFHNPDNHIVQWPNTALIESELKKFEGRSRQPDFAVSIVLQHQTVAVLFVGEVSPPSQKNNVYKNCNDLIRIGIFMKDCVDFSIDKGADVNIIGFQCVEYTIDFYTMDLKYGTYFMSHIGQVTVPASIKDMLSFVDELETLLIVREIFLKTYNELYSKLCSPGSKSMKAEFKRDTLETPKFRKLVSKTRDCHRVCPFWYGRF